MQQKQTKNLKIIAQNGISDLFLLYFKFFDGNQAKGTKKIGRNGKFFSIFDTENMNQSIHLSKKPKKKTHWE